MRLIGYSFESFLVGFNPRICKRCDKALLYAYRFLGVSIHASVKDATDGEGINVDFTQVSIHASVKDATRACIIRRLEA